MSFITKSLLTINSENLTNIFAGLKALYNFAGIDENRKNYIINKVQKYGYLPYSYIKALEELTEAETLLALEEKLKLNNTYNEDKFNFNDENISPVSRAGYQNSRWINKEGHNVKLVNLAGLGNGNKTKEPGKFIDWLKQLVILPAGNIEQGILATTMYIIPFHPREFGCAYLPKSSEVSEKLEDPILKEELRCEAGVKNLKDDCFDLEDLNSFKLDAKNQVRLFLSLAQLAGHPTMYDVLPQTGRFSKTVLAAPYVARWFDIKDLTDKLTVEIEKIALKLAQNNNAVFEETEKITLKLAQTHNSIFIERVKIILQEELSGIYIPITDDLKEIRDIFNAKLLLKKKEYSKQMLIKENQEKILKKVKEVISGMLEKPADTELTEEDITNHGEIIEKLISQGLWPAPGGAWCSSGVPVFDKMNEGGGYPLFNHFDNLDKDVTHFANLDCQTPYYFVYFDKKEYNQKVIDFYVNFLKKIRKDYNFDGFRVDHIDHIVDEVSEKEGFPISYRAPRKVLGLVNNELKKEVPHFAALAEYMLWDDFLKEYHSDMAFDLLWGNDIVSQSAKTVSRIVEDNEHLEEYNKTIGENTEKLSILKIYNNQDGEFREINQYPGQLGEAGALFKWFKFKFIPGGELASRPVMFVDGDESFTKTGIESAIGAEESMKRNNNDEFFEKFDAINRFALNNTILLKGKARMVGNNKETGFVSWLISSENSKESLFVIANEKPPTEVTRNYEGEFVSVENQAVYNIETIVPKGFSVVSEYIYKNLDFLEKFEINNLSENKFCFEKLEPSEFHIYKLV